MASINNKKGELKQYMKNCIKHITCKEAGEKCQYCTERRTYLQEVLKKIDERAKGYAENKRI